MSRSKIFYLIYHILKIPFLFFIFQKKIDSNNRVLEGVFNKRYKKIKKLGEGAQGIVFSVEDLQENNTK